MRPRPARRDGRSPDRSRSPVHLGGGLPEPFIRLFEPLSNARDAAMVGDSIVNWIYCRVPTKRALRRRRRI